MINTRTSGSIFLGALFAAHTFFSAAQAADPASCKTVRFSDVGWTDITSTTAATSESLIRK